MKLLTLIIPLLVGGLVTPVPMHEPNGKCHRPDKNPCRHKCHHNFCECGKACNMICKSSKDPYCGNKCIMRCFGQHSRCVEKCQGGS